MQDPRPGRLHQLTPASHAAAQLQEAAALEVRDKIHVTHDMSNDIRTGVLWASAAG